MDSNRTGAPLLRNPSLFLLVLLAPATFAQTGNTIFRMSPGYPVAGGIAQLFVSGVGSQLTADVVASNFPLPTTLAGISVALVQSATPQQVAMPVIAVSPRFTCGNFRLTGFWPACGRYVIVTVEIPQELNGSDKNLARFVVSENGIAGGSVEFGQWPDTGWVLTITHADGTAIDQAHPAKAGEEVVMWVTKLGPTTPTVPTGQVTPSPAPVADFTTLLYFDYRPNASPSEPLCPGQLSSCPLVKPLFAGLTPGYAGLYQVNFEVPIPPLGTPGCNANTFSPGELWSVASNLTVSILGLRSLDGFGICVDTKSPAPAVPDAEPRGAYVLRKVSVPQGIWPPNGITDKHTARPIN